MPYGVNANSGSSSRTADYQYLILPGSKSSEISWVEERTDRDNRPIDPNSIHGFVLSLGYAGYCLYFHPKHQANSRFRYLGREKDKSRAYVIAFAQKPESRDYLASYYDSNSLETIRFLVQGLVWVDPNDCHILRIYTRMLSPDKKTTLEGTMTDVSYRKVRFHDNSEFWLPHEVFVSWDFPDYTYTSRHRYSDYHIFTVNTDYKITQPKIRD